MENTIYIGTRLTFEEIKDLSGVSISLKMNSKLSEQMRSAALQKGIKKTEQGKKLCFYPVSQSDYEIMVDKKVSILVLFDNKKLQKVIYEVNSRYNGFPTFEIYRKYESELQSSLMEVVEVVGKDNNTRKSPTKVEGENPYKVGDWIDANFVRTYDTSLQKAITKFESETFGYSNILLSKSVRVYKVSDKSYWVEIPYLKNFREGATNLNFLKNNFNNVIDKFGIVSDYQHDYDRTVPYESNENEIGFFKVKSPIRVSSSDIERPRITDLKGYRVCYIQR